MIATFRVFRAVDDPVACAKYIEGHHQVLAAYGVTKVTSANVAWKDNPYTYMLLVESEDGQKIYGGCRIQIRTEALPMPLEDAVAILDPRIYKYVDKLGNYNVAEFCGLWNSKEVAGYGIGSMFLSRVAIAVVPSLKLNNFMALCSPATLRNSQKAGFHIIRDLGNNGTFYYPKEDLVATLMLIDDVVNLPNAIDLERESVFALRENPVQRRIETGPKGQLEAYFDIRVAPPVFPVTI